MSKKANWSKKNYDAIRKFVPAFVDWAQAQPELDWVDDIVSSDGAPNMLVNDGGTIKPAYNMDHPLDEARELVKTLDLFAENATVVLGCGCGYLVDQLLHQREKRHKVVIIEPHGAMIRRMFKNFNFAKELTDGDLIIVNGGPHDIAMVLSMISGQYTISNWLFLQEKYIRMRSVEYAPLVIAITETINSIMCNTGTVAGEAGAKIADNDMACLPYVIRHRGVEELRGLFKDKPCVLVSTGPSLVKNVHQLKDAQDRVVILAVGQALRVLLAYDITPDLICSVDFGDINMCHYEGLMDSGVPLVTLNRTYSPLLKAWQGPKFVAATPVPGFEHLATGILSDKGFLEAGGSVAHMVFGLAQLLGCNPITFIGQDLALGDTSHIPLVDAGGEVMTGEDGNIYWKVTDQRCRLSGDNKIISMGPQQRVDGYWGGDVYTNLGLLSFKTAFENMVARHKMTP